jgi:transcriptional regulator with XRE-family HTH domain
MSDSDLSRLRALVREALPTYHGSGRALEEALGIGHGNLSHLLDGRLELRVRHLLAIAKMLGVPPHQFLELGCPETTDAAKRDLTDFVSMSLPPERKVAAQAAKAVELDNRIRKIVHEELEARSSASETPKG